MKEGVRTMANNERAQAACEDIRSGTPINEVRKQFGQEPLPDDRADENLNKLDCKARDTA